MTFFLRKICFRTHIYIRSKTQKKITKNDRKGGGSTLMVSLTVKYPFFMPSLLMNWLSSQLIRQSIYQLFSGKANYFDPASAEYAAQSNLLHFLLIVMGFRWLYKRYITDVTFLSRRSYTQGSHKITEVNLYLSTKTNVINK